ncbi:FAD-dependent oxidoreductase [Synechococcus sp. LA31]|uniref:FAD-dependent oxidoreductase n=1 Tax=Synechococcus sp. LA31 TaxID=2741953 RepID=UPI001BDC7B81|nr:FAD-dependent oxidoreductase [Synechococcus sp. LA31]QVV68363.1 FAD-dependent oxidoreductase [Synechococcus sp. LA31]
MTQAIDAVDVLVWGGGTGGVAAAIQAARGGVSTLLLTPGSWLGGMVSAAGVCCPDGNELTPWQTGLWGAFLRELERREPEGLDHNWVSCFGYRPTTAEQILQDWVAGEPKLLWWPGCQLLEVEREGSLISSVQVDVGGEHRRVRCKVAIDGSDRGDLLPLAEAPFRLGWEPQEQWGEPSAPSAARIGSDPFFKEHPVQSPTWVVMGQLRSDRLEPDPTLGINPNGKPSLPAPFEQACEAFGLERTITYGRLPGGLVMLNWPLHGNDWHWGLNRAFSNDSTKEEELFHQMQAHSLDFAKALEDVSGGWLQLGNAFPTESGSPAPWLAAMPYWREGRRMIGKQMVIEQDLLPQTEGVSSAPLPMNETGELQSIAFGNYANDHHYPGPDWPLAPKSCRWGGRWTGTPFCIPYGCLVSESVDNLLAADKAFSTSHMANGATRLQPLILNVGQAAGAAAALAVRVEQQPGNLEPRLIQDTLAADLRAPASVSPDWTLSKRHHSPSRERMIDGVVVPDGTGKYSVLCGKDERWPLVTLEPCVQNWLSGVTRPTTARLTAFTNPWGPWLRVTSVLQEFNE